MSLNRGSIPTTFVPPLLFVAVLAVLATRMFLLNDLALLDPSEGRFAASAQHLLLTGNWVMPMTFDTQAGWEPYWAKPPLLTWLVAVSMKLFGYTEFAARFPSAVASCVSLFALWVFANRFFDRRLAVVAVLLACSTIGGFFVGFGVVTDPLLAACVSCGVVAFALHADQHRCSGFIVFLAAALGVLTKGPVAGVLIGGIIFTWCLTYKRWDALIRLPWLLGIPLFLVVAVPWFVLAERATPGYLRYYLLQENFYRYISPHLSEHIRFGSAHRHAHGMSVVFLLLMSLPWSLLLLRARLTSIRSAWASTVTNPWIGFACIWGLFPALFFAAARQILPTYVLPGMPAFSLLLALILRDYVDDRQHWRWPLLLGSAAACGGILLLILQGRFVAGLTFAVLFLIVWEAFRGKSIENSAKYALALALVFSAVLVGGADYVSNSLSAKALVDWRAEQPTTTPVAILFRHPHSTWFYTAGTGKGFALGVDPQAPLSEFSSYSAVAVESRDAKRVSEALRREFPDRTEIPSWTIMRRH